MSTVQELVTKYTFDIDSKPLKRVEEQIEGLISFSAKLALGASAAAGAIFGFAKMTAQAGDEALATSQKIGLSVENLTRLQFAAKLSNLDAGQLTVGMRFLAKNMDDAAKGTGDAGIAFRKMGIHFKDAHGKLLPTNEVLLSVADKLSKMPDGAKKTATAMDIFGKSGADLIPLLNEGAKGIQKMMDRSDELGFTMSEELARAGDEFNDSLDEMMAGLTGVRNVIGAKLLPALLPLVKKITEFIVLNRKLIATKVEVFFKMLATFAKGVWDIFAGMYRVAEGLSRVFGGLENSVKLLMGAFLIFAGAKILYMVGMLTINMWALVSAITAADIAALAIPIAIGLAIAAIALLIEDMYLFFTDPEADTMFKKFSEFFSKMPEWGQTVTRFLYLPFRALAESIKTIWSLAQTIFGDKTFKQFADDAGNNLSQLITGGGSFTGADGQTHGGRGTIGEAMGISPSTDRASVTPLSQNSVMAPTQVVNNINVGMGADITGIGKSVTQATKQGMDESLRGAQRSFNKKGGY